MAFNRDFIQDMGRNVTTIRDLIEFIVSWFSLLSNHGFVLRILQELGISLVSFFLFLIAF